MNFILLNHVLHLFFSVSSFIPIYQPNFSILIGIDNVETFFGTAPVIWNRLFTAMANLVPQKALKNVNLMNKFALFSLPMVRLVDMLVGCTNGMRYAACVCHLSLLSFDFILFDCHKNSFSTSNLIF